MYGLRNKLGIQVIYAELLLKLHRSIKFITKDKVGVHFY